MIKIARKGKFQEWLTDDGLLKIQCWAREGLIDEQIAHNIGISRSTLNEWAKKFPVISDTLKKGKAPVDFEVENALLKRALGYDVEEITTEIEELPTGKTDENGMPIIKQKKHVRKTKKHIAPDVTAQIFWLKNRKPDKWRDKVETVQSFDNELLESLIRLEKGANHD